MGKMYDTTVFLITIYFLFLLFIQFFFKACEFQLKSICTLNKTKKMKRVRNRKKNDDKKLEKQIKSRI